MTNETKQQRRDLLQRARRLLVASLCAGCATLSTPAHSESISAVLDRSQAVRLAALQSAAARSERADVVHRSFDALVKRLPHDSGLEICVVGGPAAAELLGHVVVANESLADLPEPMRLFVLAHEIGHAVLKHRQQMAALYATRMPGEIDAVKVAATGDDLAIAAARLSRQHEFEADAFAYQTLRPLGYGFADVVGALTAFGMQPDTATHPGTGKRIAHLRSLG